MIMKRANQIFSAILAVVTCGSAFGADKPLKVYIMAGQSNMQGKAQVRTIERLKLAGGDMEMYQSMMSPDGQWITPKGVHGVNYTNGDMKRGQVREITETKGPSLPGFVENPEPTTTFGPEYTFGIYMQKHLNEPILIIKTAWGGRDLIQQFRPPSAGPYKADKDKHGNETGAYYRLIVSMVQSTLANLGDYHPEYKASAGYEIAGFVWFQGYNDLIGPYPGGDYSEYTKLLADLIRDLRKDLKAPKLPVVIGVMGIGGPIENKNDKQYRFREAQAAVASLPEFQGNVVAVRTASFWDMELARIMQKSNVGSGKGKSRNLESLTPEERKIMETGISNEEFHYMGSALTYGRIGKSFADAMNQLSSKGKM